MAVRWFKRGMRAAWRWVRRRLRSRWSYRLPGEGLFFIVVTLLIGLAALNTGAQLLYLVFGMLCAFWVLSDVMATSSMARLELSRRAPRMVTAGKPVEVAAVVENRKRLWPSFSLRVSDFDGDGHEVGRGFVAWVRPRQSALATYRCVFPRRGIQRLAHMQVATRFPFGLIERRMRRAVMDEVLVLPPVVPVGDLVRRARAELGQRESRLKGQGAGLYGIRHYTPADPAREIHWKLSARSGSLLLREFESDERRRSTVVLDNRLPAEASRAARERLEEAVVLAASLVEYLVRQGHEVELVTASGRVPFSAGPPQATRCHRALALLLPEPETAVSPWRLAQSDESVRFAVLFGAQPAPAGESLIALRVEDCASLLARALQPPVAEDAPTVTLFEDLPARVYDREARV
jgi:uncharacterized protein (DUF58 family)